jgi:hypothetical protein
MDNRKVETILDELAEMSNDCYVAEYLPKISKWEKLGMTLARSNGNANNIAQLAYSFFEDWNYHSVCFVLDWIFGLYGSIHENDLKRLKDLFNKDVVVWNFDDNHKVIEKKYRVVVSYEEIV